MSVEIAFISGSARSGHGPAPPGLTGIVVRSATPGPFRRLDERDTQDYGMTSRYGATSRYGTTRHDPVSAEKPKILIPSDGLHTDASVFVRYYKGHIIDFNH